MKNEIISAADVVASSAINGVAQGIVVVLLISLGLKLAGKTNAATRYAIWFSALLLLGALPVVHALRACLVPPTRDTAHHPSIGAEPGAEELAFLIASEEADSAESQYSPREVYDGNFIDEPVNDGAPALLSPENLPLDLARNPGFGARVALEESTAPPQPSNAIATSTSLSSPPSAIPAFLKSMGSRLWKLASPSVIIGTPSFRYVGAGLVLLWAAVSTVKIVQMLRHLRAIRRLKREAKSAPGWLGCFFRQLYQKSGVARPVELKVSESLQSPVLLGFCRPVILFPQQIPTDSVEPILRHELAHVARRDDWTNLAQQTVCALFFFHPGVWWVSRKLSLEREIACDDHVLQEGSRPGHYAMLLMDLAGRLQGSRRLALLAPGVSTNKSQLKQRIDMILDTKRNRSARLGKIRLGFMTCLGTLAAVMAVYGAPRIILAHQDSATAASAGDAADNSEENVVSVVGISEDASAGEPAAPDAPPAPAGVEPGPKFKAFSGGSSFKIAAPGAVLVAPVPPVPPVPMIAAAAPPAPGEPGKPRAGRVHFADGSLEERLDRLERMVESLMAQQGAKPRLEFHWKESGDHDFKIDRKEIEKNQEMARRQVEDARKQIIELDLENITENARKEAMRASEDARRAGREAQKALAEQQRQNRDLKEGSEKQLEALRKHHEMLKREMEKLDRQIQEIQKHRDHWGHPDNREIDQNENENQNLNEDLNENPAPQPAKR